MLDTSPTSAAMSTPVEACWKMARVTWRCSTCSTSWASTPASSSALSGRHRRAEGEPYAEAPAGGVVEMRGLGRGRTGRGEKPNVADEQRLGELPAALQPHLLAGVRPLGLADLAERPEEARPAIRQRNVEPRTGDVHAGTAASRRPPVEIGRLPVEAQVPRLWPRGVSRGSAASPGRPERLEGVGGHFGAPHLGKPEVDVEEAGEAFAGRAHLLRLLRDALQRQRPVEREPRESAARRAHGEPRPRQADGAEQADPRRDRQPRELRAGHRRAEARAGEPRVLGVVALALGSEPEPREPERRHEEQDRPQPRSDEIAPAAVEGEALRAEPRVAGEEPLLAGDEERIVQPERERGEQPAADPDADELARGGTQREADTAPRSAAQAVAPRADHGDRDEDAGKDRDGQPGGHDDER